MGRERKKNGFFSSAVFLLSPYLARVHKYGNWLFIAENSTETLASQASIHGDQSVEIGTYVTKAQLQGQRKRH